MDNINQVFKDIVLEVTIDARLGSKGQAIETHATFFSHDVKTGLVKINIKKDGQPLPLPVGTQVIVSLTKPKEPGKGKLVYTPEIVDGNAGVVHWPIPEQIQGDVGEFRAGVYVRYPTDQRLHGGYFKFNKEISEIDENLEPWTESYWQGWADFQDEAEAAWSEWQANREHDWTQWTTTQQAKQDDFEAATNAQMSTVTKQLTDLEAQTETLDQKQKDLIAQLADYMTKEQFVRFLAGETIEVTNNIDLKNKVSNSNVENPNSFSYGTWTKTNTPTPQQMTWNPPTEQFGEMYALDGRVRVMSYNTADRKACAILKWNLVESIERRYPGLFSALGALDAAGKLALTKQVTSNFVASVWAYGQSPSGNYMSSDFWLNSNSWGAQTFSTASSITEMSVPADNLEAISNDGFVYQLLQSESSDGTTSAGLRIDYAQLTYSLKLSLYDFVPKKSDIYDKSQADQRFVSLSENQTVGGVKNFIERPTYDGTELLVPGEAQMIKVTADNGGMALSMDNSKTLLQWIADAGWGIRSCYMTADVVGGTGFSGRGLIVNNESATSMAGYILMNKNSSLEFNNGLMVRHFLPDTISGGIMWASDWIKCGSTNKTRLTPTTTGVAAGQTIELAKDVRNFTMLNVCTGGVSDGANIIQSISPYVDSTWRPAADGSMDRWGVLTANGARVILVLTSYTTLRVESTPAGSAGIRYIDGIM